MKITLIIATRDRCAALAETLRAIGAQPACRTSDAELIVVDNGSSDDTASIVQSCRLGDAAVRYVREDRPGKSSALNAAIGLQRGDIAVFLDDDVRPRVDWLETLIRDIAGHRCDAVCGGVRIAPHLLRTWMTPTHKAWLASTHYIDPAHPQTAVGANMAVSREVLQRIPRFDPELGPGKLGLWEDTLFSLQLRDAGFRLQSEPRAVVEHYFEPTRLSRKSFLNHARMEGRSSAYVAWHWSHSSAAGARRDLLHYRVRLLAKRLLHRAAVRRSEGAELWEMNLECEIAFATQLLIESRKPRKYARPVAQDSHPERGLDTPQPSHGWPSASSQHP